MDFCPHCMRPASGKICNHCGGDLSWDNGAALLRVGTVLSGDHTYQIGKAIGQGGFGVTYVARDLTAQQRVAVKEFFPLRCSLRGEDGRIVPKPGMEAIYEGGRYSFVREAMMLASLENVPNVVQGLAYLELNNTAYLVMEFLDGTPLYKLVEKNGRIEAGVLLPQMEPLMRDIGRLHAKGIIHRDISPDNIMWMPDNTLKLLDFGSARSMEDGKSMTVLVKKGFAPVEQYQRRGQGAYTDVYALAATIYYCLTGVTPPASPDRQLSGVSVQSPISLGVALTPEEEQALMWGLEVEPKLRPADMDQFSKRLFVVKIVEPPVDTHVESPVDPHVESPVDIHMGASKIQNWLSSGSDSSGIPWRTIAICAGAGVLGLLLFILILAGL